MSIYDSYVAPDVQPATVSTPVPVATVLSPSEAQTTLNNYGIDPTQTLTSTNVAATVTNPTPAPDDLLGIRANISKELGLDTQNTAYQNALTAARNKVTDLNKTTAIMEGNRVNMGVIRGEQAQARNLAAPEIQALQDQATLEQNKLNSLTAERDYRVGVAESNINFTKQLKLQYAGAGINYGDSMDTVESKIKSYADDQKKTAYTDTLKSMALQMGIKTKGKNTKELEKAISKINKNSVEQAKRTSDLQYNTALEQYNKLKQANVPTGGGGGGSIASYFGD